MTAWAHACSEDAGHRRFTSVSFIQVHVRATLLGKLVSSALVLSHASCFLSSDVCVAHKANSKWEHVFLQSWGGLYRFIVWGVRGINCM